jgi:hypothetical protein
LILAALLLAGTSVEAERAFAEAAQVEGQWTAFRRYAAPDATMFTPQPVSAQAFLWSRDDPPRAVRWSPARVWTSCDGSTAVHVGPALHADGSTGGFLTVWRRQPDGGWRWIADASADVAKGEPLGAEPVVREAGCAGSPPVTALAPAEGGRAGVFASPDRTLRVDWHVAATGARHVEVRLWNGHEHELVADDRQAAGRG